MSHPIHPMAMFRLMVLGPLASRSQLERGELSAVLQALASQTYQHPNGRAVQFSPRTLERWYYAWLRHGIDGLVPKARKDKGESQLPTHLQQLIIETKKAKPARSINQLLQYLSLQHQIAKGSLSRASVHRLLRQHGLSGRTPTDSPCAEHRSFEAQCAGDIWYGDVMHGPHIHGPDGCKKTYLVSLMDDASRLICHSAFYFSENALAIEHVLKQALLKRGLPKKLVVDNGAAYRSGHLKTICARLGIYLIYCRPYHPEGKGKLERWHRTVREQFLAEIALARINGLDDINTRLWIWVETLYHQTPHSAFSPTMTPLARWQKDLNQVQSLGSLRHCLDSYFTHRYQRRVRKDGTISFEGQRYEVPYQCAGDKVVLVVDPHQETIIGIESLQGDALGKVVPLDKHANLNRTRVKPHIPQENASGETQNKTVELALQKAQRQQSLPFPTQEDKSCY